MTNTPYQVIIRELEAILPPRVVSRMLKDGLQQLEREPATVTVADLERLLEGQVQQQLLGIMPPENAGDALRRMIDRLNQPADPAVDRAATAAADAAALAQLALEIRPFNLYFEWPEVQKLRAQMQLIEAELEADQPAGNLLGEAREQLAFVQQKHEDQLVIQARDLAELETSFGHISTLGGPRVRRLENLLRQVRQNQQERNLALAELERARQLSVELRKLLESSVYTTSERPAAGDDELPDPEEVAARLRQLDLDSERHRIDQLAKKFENLLRFHPELNERLAALRESLSSDAPAVPDLITAPEVMLQEAFVQLRNELAGEIDRMSGDAAALATPVGTTRLRQALRVTRGILASTLPDPADISHIRDLYALALEQASLASEGPDDEAADATVLADIYMGSREELLTELYQLEREVRSLSGAGVSGYEELNENLKQTHALVQDGQLTDFADLVGLREQLEAVREEIAGRLDTFPARLVQALATFSRVERLNSDDVQTAGRILRHLDDQKDVFGRISPQLRISLEQSLQTAEELLVKLQAEFEATRAIADQLVSANILDGLLGPGSPLAAAEPARQQDGRAQAPAEIGGPATLSGFVDDLLLHPGVTGAALLDRSGTQLAGSLIGQDTADAAGLLTALQQLDAGLSGLAVLGAGEQRLLQLEFDTATLIISWPAEPYRLVLLVSSPVAVDPLLSRLQRDLGLLEKLLDGTALT